MRLGMLTTLLRVPCRCELPDVPASETLPRVAGLAPKRSCPTRSCRMPRELRDARNDLLKQRPCQVAFGQLPVLRENVMG